MKNINYSILCREINKENGDIAAYCLMNGSEKELSSEILPLHMRAIYNPELRYFICLEKYQDEIISLLKKQDIETKEDREIFDKMVVKI